MRLQNIVIQNGLLNYYMCICIFMHAEKDILYLYHRLYFYNKHIHIGLLQCIFCRYIYIYTYVRICTHIDKANGTLSASAHSSHNSSVKVSYTEDHQTIIEDIPPIHKVVLMQSWEPKGTPPPKSYVSPKKYCSRPYDQGLLKPLVSLFFRPAIRAGYFLGVNVAWGGVA